jgi:hypothetical protein
VDNRLEWIGTRIIELEQRLRAWQPTAVIVTRTIDHERKRVRLAGAVQEPPSWAAPAVGEILYGLRAALDNAVGVLRLGGPGEQSQFPIWRPEHSTATDFAQRAGRYLQGLPDCAVDIIGPVAIRPDGSESTAIDMWVRQIGLALAVLEELAIVDRHRALLVTVAVPSVQYVTHDGAADVQFRFSGDFVRRGA